MKEYASFGDACRTVLDAVEKVSTERVVLDEALGRTLAQDVQAEGPVPRFDNSAMDGFAVRSTEQSGCFVSLGCGIWWWSPMRVRSWGL